MTAQLRVFVSSVQKELEDERLIVQNLVHTDSYLLAHCVPVLYELEPASPAKALEGCLTALDGCQVYLLIVGSEYGTRIGELSITHAEYRRAKKKRLPVLAFIKGDRRLAREEGTRSLLDELEADVLSSFHRLEERGRGFRRMHDQMLDHGLDAPVIDTITGYFQVTFPGPGEHIERLRVPTGRLQVTPAVEAQLNDRQKAMVALLVQGEELTSRRCEEEFAVTRDTATRDFKLLMDLGLARKEGRGRSTRYLADRAP